MTRLGSLRRNSFIVLGRAGMDLYADPPGTRAEEATRFYACLGGSAGNIAAGIARLEGRAALLGAVSDDAVGRFTLNALRGYDIDARHVAIVGGQRRNSLAVVETRLENTQSVIYRNDAADFALDAAQLAQVDWPSYGALIVTGTAFAAEPSRGAAFAAIERARDAEVCLILDVDYRPYSWSADSEAATVYGKAAARCDIVIGNDDEFGVMAGSRDAGLALARRLSQSTAEIAIYKMGAKGAVTFAAGQTLQTGTFAVAALKPTGAGDAFMAGFVCALARGMALQDCLKQGSAAAALVVTRVGCAPAMPTRAELDGFVASHAAGPLSMDTDHAYSAL